MIVIRANNKLETYRRDTGILSINITGYELGEGDYVVLSVKKDIKDTNYIFQKRIDKFEDNQVVFIFTEDDTDIKEGIYKYDVKIYLKDGTRDRLIKPSDFSVLAGVTNE